jgi:hypothetical protein
MQLIACKVKDDNSSAGASWTNTPKTLGQLPANATREQQSGDICDLLSSPFGAPTPTQ